MMSFNFSNRMDQPASAMAAEFMKIREGGELSGPFKKSFKLSMSAPFWSGRHEVLQVKRLETERILVHPPFEFPFR
jgi:hypothetical protein